MVYRFNYKYSLGVNPTLFYKYSKKRFLKVGGYILKDILSIIVKIKMLLCAPILFFLVELKKRIFCIFEERFFYFLVLE